MKLGFLGAGPLCLLRGWEDHVHRGSLAENLAQEVLVAVLVEDQFSTLARDALLSWSRNIRRMFDGQQPRSRPFRESQDIGNGSRCSIVFDLFMRP